MAAPNDTVAEDDALYVLTAVLLTPAQFPTVLGDDYPAACAALAVEPYAEGYGLVLGQDGTGARWTVVVDDVSLVAVAIAAWDCGMEYDLSPTTVRWSVRCPAGRSRWRSPLRAWPRRTIRCRIRTTRAPLRHRCHHPTRSRGDRPSGAWERTR